MHNCDLVNLEDMLQNGTVISGTMIEKPHSFSTACNIATQIIAQVASNQYGGQSISLTHLAPFVQVSREKITASVKREYKHLGIDLTETQLCEVVESRLRDEIERGVALRSDGHVGVYVGNGNAVEERGFSYGCVKTKVASRKWTHWFQLPFVDYGDAVFTGGSYVKPDTATTEYTLGTRTIQNGSKGTDVKALQEFLLQMEYALPKYGADGEFGSETETALKKFQSKIGIKQDGIYGSETHQALMDAVADDDAGKETPETDVPETPEVEQPSAKRVQIVCGTGSVNIRVGNDAKYSRITSVKNGATYEWIATAENGWHAIVVNAQIGWVSGKYSAVV